MDRYVTHTLINFFKPKFDVYIIFFIITLCQTLNSTHMGIYKIYGLMNSIIIQIFYETKLISFDHNESENSCFANKLKKIKW